MQAVFERVSNDQIKMKFTSNVWFEKKEAKDYFSVSLGGEPLEQVAFPTDQKKVVIFLPHNKDLLNVDLQIE